MEEEEDHHQHKYMESRTPHFFKVILHDPLHVKKLVIPESFVRKYGRDLCSNKVCLKVATGDTWEVELHKEEDGGSMWLLNGWQDFLEFYDIKFGYFLVFGYLGNSEFQLLIFDKSTSEIKYPCKCEINEEERKADVDLGPCLFPVKPEVEETDADMLVDHNASRIDDCENNTDYTGQGSRDYDYFDGELGEPKNFGLFESTENLEAFIGSTAFNSPNPCFQIVMRSTYVNKHYALWLPGRFIRDHIGQKDCFIKLSVPCGRFWIVRCRFRTRGNQPDARVQQGWKPFVRDNNLAVGDVCIFELIDSVEVHFQVTIFRAAKDPSFIHCPVKSEPEECDGIGRQVSWKPPCHEVSSSDIQCATTSNHPSKNPFFKLVMTEARVRSSKVPIRAAFLKHLKPGAQVVALEVAGRLWRVKVCFYQRRPGREGFFSCGWRNFARENSLQVGDICIFELIEREEVVLKVSIHKRQNIGQLRQCEQ